MEDRKRKHFVLVHGASAGAWAWFKITALLEQAGHRVTAIDLGACGRRPEKLSELKGFADYAQPLIAVMDALPTSGRVILVGHSFGGFPMAWAMERFPEKIAVAVFTTAFMPDSSHPPSYPFKQYIARTLPGFDYAADTDCEVDKKLTTKLFTPAALRSKFYKNCSEEDFTLGKSLMRPTSLFLNSLSNLPNFSAERYGSVSRVYIMCMDDLAIPVDCQRWMVENYPPKELKEIATADHMPVLSTPRELSIHLMDIASVY